MIPSCCWCSVDFVFILKRSQFFPRDLSFDGLLLHKCVMHWNIAFCGRQIFYPRSKLHFQEYFPLQYHTCHLIPGGENRDFYCYCCIVTHPICVSKEAAASFKKVIASLQLPSPGSFLSNFLQVLLRSIFRQFLSQLCIMSKVCSVI